MKKQDEMNEVLMDVEDENVEKAEKKSLWKKIKGFVRTHKALCATIGVGAVVGILLVVLKKSDGNDEDLVEAVENSVESVSPYDTSNIDDDTLEEIIVNAQNAAIEAYNNAVNAE
ncbi:MAG: hypothetical protein Q4C64_04115 [Erysipelotrichia bacterium]|nr:hypothetical protein [Erysipelotrichia bacterium]